MLEINERPRRDLRILIDTIGQRAVERALGVHRTTIARWGSGVVQMPGAAHQAVRHLLGDLPGTAGRWTGWRFHDGELIAPGGDRYTPGDVLAIRLQQQRVSALEHENRELRARVRVLEKTVDLFGPAANESRPA